LDLIPICTKPFTLQANGKAERFIMTLRLEWAYVIDYQTSAERNRWLPRHLGNDNGHRLNMAPGGINPQQCIHRLVRVGRLVEYIVTESAREQMAWWVATTAG
jgi:hypothetical protein